MVGVKEQLEINEKSMLTPNLKETQKKKMLTIQALLMRLQKQVGIY